MNLKPGVLKNFVFDCEMCFILCEVYRFQNLEGLKLLIKHSFRSGKYVIIFTPTFLYRINDWEPILAHRSQVFGKQHFALPLL